MIAAAVEADRGEQERRLAAFRAKDAARKRRERAAERQLHPTDSSGRLGSRPGSASDERPAGPLDTAINAAGLAERLTSAASGNVDQLADTGPIVDLLDQGCDLDLGHKNDLC